MKPLYAAHIADIGPSDHLEIECTCGNRRLLSGDVLSRRAIDGNRQVPDLTAKMRCTTCYLLGGATISIVRGRRGSRRKRQESNLPGTPGAPRRV